MKNLCLRTDTQLQSNSGKRSRCGGTIRFGGRKEKLAIAQKRPGVWCVWGGGVEGASERRGGFVEYKKIPALKENEQLDRKKRKTPAGGYSPKKTDAIQEKKKKVGQKGGGGGAREERISKEAQWGGKGCRATNPVKGRGGKGQVKREAVAGFSLRPAKQSTRKNNPPRLRGPKEKVRIEEKKIQSRLGTLAERRTIKI